MNWINRIKISAGDRVLANKLRNSTRVPAVCNISDARHIGIIYNATEFVSFEIIRNLVKELTHNSAKVTVLGYVDSKKLIDHYLYRKGFDFFSKNELNWYSKPVSPVVEHFIEEKFDLLISLSLEEYYPIRYITALSPALFKAGKYSDNEHYLDFMIDIEKEKQAMKNLHKEIMNEAHPKSGNNEIEADLEKKTDTEVQLNFLITQLLYYLSVLKNK
jgi:hypothetical protein